MKRKKEIWTVEIKISREREITYSRKPRPGSAAASAELVAFSPRTRKEAIA